MLKYGVIEMDRALKIGILEGDDIGLEVVPETIKVMKAAASKTGLAIEWFPMPIGKTAFDKLDLPGASIIGNQELPVGLDIVPWRPAAAGNVKDGPTQLLDEPLEPVDPEIFRHQLQIYSDTRH